jgi:hypothetical protein
MAEFAARGKTSVDWFYGFKVHLVIFFVNLVAGLVAYTFPEKKSSLNIRLPQSLPAVVL